MSFGRHRVQPGLNGHTIERKKDDRKTIGGHEENVLTIVADELKEEAVINLPEEKKAVKKKSHKAVKSKPGEPIINSDIEKEEINPLKKKYIDNTGLVGQNTICRDFRAICKKKGLQMNKILNTLLHEWNTANYNL